ncbi:uncharacterized protein HMPREF1541_05429 [Cyphellophora europaea CBS 101466]|uniref:Uncharacterized protein n=1 Tax=Cyphellophora europaea (strain CBS 101466) TaxID=1220924 RepID=W2RRQ1_CYPE1|nr:uncharacterized protein HMPREF1541_05429 [Cyphellophora europaea CBS 101466]ETN39206.1 hypothetical protein HMPREF1541_05429 [Cyphellophora europaea CBS 101466]
MSSALVDTSLAGTAADRPVLSDLVTPWLAQSQIKFHIHSQSTSAHAHFRAHRATIHYDTGDPTMIIQQRASKKHPVFGCYVLPLTRINIVIEKPNDGRHAFQIQIEQNVPRQINFPRGFPETLACSLMAANVSQCDLPAFLESGASIKVLKVDGHGVEGSMKACKRLASLLDEIKRKAVHQLESGIV